MEKINYRKDIIFAEDVIAANKPYVHIDIWDKHSKRQLQLDYIYHQAVKCLDDTKYADKLNTIIVLLPHPVDGWKLPEGKRNLEFDLWAKGSWYEVSSWANDHTHIFNTRTDVRVDIYFVVGMSDANTKDFRTSSKLNLVHIGLETYMFHDYVEQEVIDFINKNIAKHISQDTSILRTTNHGASNFGEELTAVDDLNFFLHCWLRITTPMELKRLQKKLSEYYLDDFTPMKFIKYLEDTVKEKHQQIGIEYIPDVLECHRDYLDNLWGAKYNQGILTGYIPEGSAYPGYLLANFITQEGIKPRTIRLPNPEKMGNEQTYTEYTLENYSRWLELQD